MQKRRSFTGLQRLQIVLEGLQSDTSVAELCRRHEISATLYYQWRDKLFENADRVFEKKRRGEAEPVAALQTELDRMRAVVAEITAENLELKKTPGASGIMSRSRRSSGR